MAVYEIENEQGQRVKFEWMGETPPTEADMAEVFASIQQPAPPAEPKVSKYAGREGYSYLPTGEAISPEERRAKGKVIAEEQITPILEGVGATIGGVVAPGLGAIPGAGVGYAVGEKLGDILGGEETGTPLEEAKEFGKEALTGAALEATGLGIGKVVGKGAEALSRKLYESAIKFSTKLSQPERARFAKAGLDKAIFPTEKGLLKLERQIDSINNQISKGIQKAKQKGRVSTKLVSKEIDKVKARYADDIDFDEIVEVLDGLKAKLAKRGLSITAEEAQNMKVLAYKSLKGKYGEMKNFAIEGKKGLARGLMLQIEKLHPQIKELNKSHATFKGLEEQIERAAGRIRNREIFSLLATTAGAAGAAGTQSPEGLYLGLMMQMLVSPRSKTGIGIALNKALKASGGATSIRRALGPLITNLKTEQNQLQGE